MNNPEHPLWQKFLVEAAVTYFNRRQVKACLLVDNAVLKDGVLEAQHLKEDREFIICVAPYFATHLVFGDHNLSATVCFDGAIHSMTIPYHAIKAVLASDHAHVLTDEGHMNVISIPPVVYPPGIQYRSEPVPEPVLTDTSVQTLESQPKQTIMRKVGQRR